MSSKNDLGLKSGPGIIPGVEAAHSLGPTGPQGHPGPIGDPGFRVKGLDEPAAPAIPAAPDKPPKAFIILIRHITKGTLHVVARGDGAVAEFEEMEHALNQSVNIPACQKNPSFVIPIYE